MTPETLENELRQRYAQRERATETIRELEQPPHAWRDVFPPDRQQRLEEAYRLQAEADEAIMDILRRLNRLE